MFERFRRRQQEPGDWREREGVTGAQDVDPDGRAVPREQYANVGTARQGATDPDTHRTDVLPSRDRDGDGVADDREGVVQRRVTPAAATAPAVADVRARQRDEFGGTSWGSAFFGWLVALGLSALLVSLVAAAGAALGYTDNTDVSSGDAETIGIVGGALLVLVLAVSYFAGGYVAGRMSRFDGARQGFAVWLVGIVVMLVLAGLGLALGSEYNVFQGLDLPRIPIDEGDLTTGGLIALAAVVLGTLLAAIAGGKAGERYHVRVDRYGLERDYA